MVAREACKSHTLTKSLNYVARKIRKHPFRPYPLDYYISKNHKNSTTKSNNNLVQTPKSSKNSMSQLSEPHGQLESIPEFSPVPSPAPNIYESWKCSSGASLLKIIAIFPGKRKGLFKFKNSVISLILLNRKFIRESSILKLIQR